MDIESYRGSRDNNLDNQKLSKEYLKVDNFNISSKNMQSVIYYMNTKLALEIISLCYSTKKINFPWDIRQVWYKVFNEPLPTSNMHGIPDEQSISFEEVKNHLFTAAIEYLVKKIDN